MIRPEHLTASQWAAQTGLTLFQYGFIPKLTQDDLWRDWAVCVISLPQLSALGMPRPERFAVWQDWANAFNEKARLLNP